MRRLFNARRGLSPIFATLILIAIAVIAGIVVYMFTSGAIGVFTGSAQPGTEKIAIQSIQGTTGGTITVYAMSQSGGPIALDSAIVKDGQGNTLGAPVSMTDQPVGTTLTTLTITSPVTLVEGNTYSVQLVSVAGGNFPSQSFKATAPTA